MPTHSDALVANSTTTLNGTTTLAAATTVSGALDTTSTVDLSASTVTFAADAVDSAEITDGAVDPVHLAITGYREVASDVTAVLGATDTCIQLLESTTGTKAVTMTATHQGHLVHLRLEARSGGSYTLAVTGGTITLDAANEGCSVVYSGSAWELQTLSLGTFA